MKFASWLPSRSPKAVAVVVPARHAYSHCDSVGSLYDHPAGNRPARRSLSVSLRQNSSASSAPTKYIGWLGLSPRMLSLFILSNCSRIVVPMTFSHCSWVTSYLPIQKPLLKVTFTGPSFPNRSGSLLGLPKRNDPGGHQQSFIFSPLSSRSSPAREPWFGRSPATTRWGWSL